MNNNLSLLSDKELSDKSENCSAAISFIDKRCGEALKHYSKLYDKNWVNPQKLLSAKRDLEDFRNVITMLVEYERTLTDEYNSRC